eukprot:superscaffoldBa00007657_g22727
MSPGEMTLEGLLEMSEEQVCELLQKFGANEEECARLNASLSCLRKAHQLESVRRSQPPMPQSSWVQTSQPSGVSGDQLSFAITV